MHYLQPTSKREKPTIHQLNEMTDQRLVVKYQKVIKGFRTQRKACPAGTKAIQHGRLDQAHIELER
jgi:hypothetical protein